MLEATILGCGSENEPTCEPVGHFIVDHSFTSETGYYTISNHLGVVDDYITTQNIGNTGHIYFYSDPLDANFSVAAQGKFLGNLCNEVFSPEGPGFAGGCSGRFTLTTTGNTTLTVEPASDSESSFDPFGWKADTSDEIRFSGITIIGAPEPSIMVLLGAGLLLGATKLRKRLLS